VRACINRSELPKHTTMSTPLCAVADEILLALLKHMPAPWRLAVSRSLLAFLRAQDGTHNNPKLTAYVKVNAQRYLASSRYCGKEDRLLAVLHQHCGRYAVQGLALAGLRAEFRNANLGRVLSLTPSLTELDLSTTFLRLDSFADILGQLTALHTMWLSGNSDFMRVASSPVFPTALTKLHLAKCCVTEFQLRMLIGSLARPGLALTDLGLENNALQRTTLLPDLLEGLTALQRLDLSMTDVASDYLVAVTRALPTSLRVLRLAGLPVNDPRKIVIPRKLSTGRIALRVASDKRIFDSLCRLPRLESLNLNGMHVGANVDALATALSLMPQMQSLSLCGIDVDAAGAASIAGVLSAMHSLKSVQMYDVPIGPSGARAFVAAVAGHATPVELYLTGSNFCMEDL